MICLPGTKWTQVFLRIFLPGNDFPDHFESRPDLRICEDLRKPIKVYEKSPKNEIFAKSDISARDESLPADARGCQHVTPAASALPSFCPSGAGGGIDQAFLFGTWITDRQTGRIVGTAQGTRSRSGNAGCRQTTQGEGGECLSRH